MSNPFQSFDEVTRRQLMESAAKSCLGVSILPLANQVAVGADRATVAGGKKAKQVIYLFLEGGMTQLDTFDPKPNSEHQGETKAISTSVSGVQLSEHMVNLAKNFKDIALIRSMTTSTAAHAQARYLMRTNYKKIASTQHPILACWVHRFLGRVNPALPASVLVSATGSPGYMGAKYAPVPVADPNKGLENTQKPSYLTEDQFERRMKLANTFDQTFRAKTTTDNVKSYDELYQDAIQLLNSQDLEAFDISKESEAARQSYGSSRFGRGCLLARRLIENGVRFVEVKTGGWDHHYELFEKLPAKAAELDLVLNTLIQDLKQKGLFESTLIVLTTEFGRRPKLNFRVGRDHHPAAFCSLMAGGGVRGGQVYGESDEDAHSVMEDPLTPHDFNATIGYALGLPINKIIHSPQGRPFTMAHKGQPVTRLFS